MMTKSRRRVAVAGLYLGYLGMGITWCLTRGHPGSIDWSILVTAGALSLACLVSVWQAAGGLVLASTHLLDERQRSVRDRAFRVAYLLVSLAFLATTALYSWLFVHPDRPIGGASIFPLAIGAVLITLTLPPAVVAWTESDPPEDSGTFTKTGK